MMLQAEKIGTPGKIDEITLEIKKGELMGFAGLLGSGRTETAEMLFGANRSTKGEISVNGKKVDIPSYSLQPGDKITLKEKSRKNVQFEANFKGLISVDAQVSVTESFGELKLTVELDPPEGGGLCTRSVSVQVGDGCER